MKRQENLQSQSLILPVFAAISVVLFIVLCWYAYNNFISGAKTGGAVYIKADNSPFKVKPSEPGGMKIGHKDKQIFNTITSETENLEKGINVIKEEEPVNQDKIISQTANAEKTIVEETGKDSEVLLKNIKAEEKIKPKAGDIVVTQKNGDIQKLQEMKPEEEPVEQVEKAKTDVIKIVKSPAPEKKAVTKIETTKSDNGENNTKIVFQTPASILKAGVKPAATTGSFYIQIGAYASDAEAQKAWVAASAKLGADVSGFNKRIQAANVNGKTYYRLAFGTFKTRQDAANKCLKIKAKAFNCLVTN